MSKINTNKINNYEPIRGVRGSDIKSAGKSETSPIGTKPNVGEDKLEFSGRAAEAKKFLDQLKDLPDVREEKVSVLRERIASGDYQPSNEDIADAILADESQS